MSDDRYDAYDPLDMEWPAAANLDMVQATRFLDHGFVVCRRQPKMSVGLESSSVELEEDRIWAQTEARIKGASKQESAA